MSEGRIIRGREIDEDLNLEPDVCVIGSGAGGSVVAAGLAARGRSVVVLEEGSYFQAQDFTLHERDAYPTLYQDLGNRATADLSITILQGRAVGGTTLVNWTTCYRTPTRILDHWADRFGLELSEARLAPHFDSVEARLGIHRWDEGRINANNGALWRGLGALGLERHILRRNVRGCADSGYCGMGCPVGAKQAMHLTYLADALEAGASVYANCRAEQIEVQGARARVVHAELLDESTQRPSGRRITVRPKLVVVAGGAINTPVLLLKSGLDGGGKVGKRTWLHPVVGVGALYREEIRPFYGAPQSVASHHFIERDPGQLGFFLESAPLHPMLAATALGGSGRAHQEIMSQLPHIAVGLGILLDGLLPEEQGGTVTLRSDGRPRIEYPLEARHWEAFRASSRILSRIHLAAGARKVLSMHDEPVSIESEADLPKLDAAPWQKLRIPIFTAHQMGGCPMGADPERSVVDRELRLRGVDNLFVCDGSVFPTALGVNPSETIYGLAHWAAGPISGAI